MAAASRASPTSFVVSIMGGICWVVLSVDAEATDSRFVRSEEFVSFISPGGGHIQRRKNVEEWTKVEESTQIPDISSSSTDLW